MLCAWTGNWQCTTILPKQESILLVGEAELERRTPTEYLPCAPQNSKSLGGCCVLVKKKEKQIYQGLAYDTVAPAPLMYFQIWAFVGRSGQWHTHGGSQQKTSPCVYVKLNANFFTSIISMQGNAIQVHRNVQNVHPVLLLLLACETCSSYQKQHAQGSSTLLAGAGTKESRFSQHS